MALDRQYLTDELTPSLRRELQKSVQMPLVPRGELPPGTAYKQAYPSVQMPIYPNSIPNLPSEAVPPNMAISRSGGQYTTGDMYVPPERVGLLSNVPGMPNTEVTALPPSAELMSNAPRDALKLGLGAGEAIAQDRSQGNAISGLLGDINWKGLMDKLLQTFQRPEMLTPGVNALTSFGMSGAALNQAEIAGAKEKAKLDQANQQQALENEYRRTRDSRDAAKLALDEEKARADRLKAPTITKAKMEAFRALVSGDDTVRKIVEKLDGTRFGRFIGNSSSTDSIETAIAMEAITIQNNNSRISPLKAVQEAAKRLQAKASAAPSETKKDRFPPKNQ